MVLMRCDACGFEEVEANAVENHRLFVRVGVAVGVTRFDGHSCSSECFAKVIEKLTPRAAESFAKLG